MKLLARHIAVFFLFFAFLSAYGQRSKKEVKVETDTLPTDIVFSIYDFNYLNTYVEYYNEGLLQKMAAYERDQEWEKLYLTLKLYVSRFGVRNFYKDTRLIWKLAKLTELYGEPAEAKSLYRLVLRHHHQGINLKEIELYYDSLNTQEAAQYVPLEYYYELVEHRKLIDTLRPPRGILLNMGINVNSRKADYGPTLNFDNDVLIFTSKRNEVDNSVNKRDNEDLYLSVKDDYNEWSMAIPLEQINTAYNEGSARLTRDGKTLYFSRCDCPQCFGDCDIFMAKLQADSTWGEIQNLGVNVNSLAWDSHPSLSHGEDTLYFASDRIGGFGLSDIYYTFKLPNGEWAPARNAGPVINTRSNEVSPFYHPIYDVLYFASNGQLYNFGEYDIYKSHRVGVNWSEPYNIGPLVNGKGSEFYFTIDSKSENLYYARTLNRDLTKMDLYSFPLPMEARPDADVLLSGSLTDSITGKPFRGLVSIIDLDEGIEVAPRYLRPDGTFEFRLIDKRNYLLVIQGDEYFRVEKAFFLDGPMTLNEVTEPLSARVKFESIEFETGKSQLKTAMYADLNKIVNFLYDNHDFLLRITGHTDSYGSEDVNLRLSRERAKNIHDYIVIFAGVHESRVSWEGYGSSQPIVPETSEANRAINRRVEFEIYRPGKENFTPGKEEE